MWRMPPGLTRLLWVLAVLASLECPPPARHIPNRLGCMCLPSVMPAMHV